MRAVLHVIFATSCLTSLVGATQSVFSCPLNPGFIEGGVPGVLPQYGNGIGEVCGTGSFMHYWTCCQEYPFECCFQMETWAVVTLSMVLVVIVGIGLLALGRYVSNRYYY
ncbi:Protein H05C05.4 [Aphelenchoides avenae]|nr:Protein H05C05.4 [Aphelenchus avenae]